GVLQGGGTALGLSTLGAAGLFPAFAAAIFAVEVIHFFAQRRWGIRLSGGAPDVVVRSFAAMLPATVCVVVVWLLVHVLGVDLVGGITALFRPLVRGGDTFAAVLLVVLIDSALWMVGMPVVMNGKLAPPFVLAPAIMATLSWLAMHFGLVRPPYIEVVWTLPAPIGAYLSSGGDVRAVVLQMLNLGIALAIWWPFVRRYDRFLLSSERTAP